MANEKKEKQFKRHTHEVKDLDEKGQIKFYFAAFNNKDSDGDIIMPGAYTKTIQENKARIKHLRNHDEAVGVITELGQDQHGAFAISQLALKTKDGLDTYEQYKAGIITEHSHGFNTIKEDYDKTKEANIIREVRLWEVSSLTKWGANELTHVIGMKDFTDEKELLTLYGKLSSLIKNSKLSDESLKQISTITEEIKALLPKPGSSTSKGNESPVNYFIDNLKL